MLIQCISKAEYLSGAMSLETSTTSNISAGLYWLCCLTEIFITSVTINLHTKTKAMGFNALLVVSSKAQTECEQKERTM